MAREASYGQNRFQTYNFWGICGVDRCRSGQKTMRSKYEGVRTLGTGKMSKWKITPLRRSITTHSYPRGPKAQPQLQGSWPIAKHE